MMMKRGHAADSFVVYVLFNFFSSRRSYLYGCKLSSSTSVDMDEFYIGFIGCDRFVCKNSYSLTQSTNHDHVVEKKSW